MKIEVLDVSFGVREGGDASTETTSNATKEVQRQIADDEATRSRIALMEALEENAREWKIRTSVTRDRVLQRRRQQRVSRSCALLRRRPTAVIVTMKSVPMEPQQHEHRFFAHTRLHLAEHRDRSSPCGLSPAMRQ